MNESLSNAIVARFAMCTAVAVTVLVSAFSCAMKPADQSLSLEEYRNLGVPDPVKPWQISDYTQAWNALSLVKWRMPHQLPVRDSPKSGALFSHMLSLDYLSFLEDTTMALHEKAMQLVEFVRVYDYWMDIYSAPTLKKNHYHREIVALKQFHLHLMESMLHLANRINASDDPADKALQYGYKSIKGNYLTALSTFLEMPCLGPPFLTRDLETVADSVYASAMRNRSVLDHDEVAVLVRSLQSATDSTSSKYVRRKYLDLQRSLKET